MSRSARKNPDWLVFGAILIAVAALGGYVCGYFLTSTLDQLNPGSTGGEIIYVRTFRHRWLYAIYRPMRRIESAMRGAPVRGGYPSG